MKDVVCGMDVAAARFRSTYKGKEYGFCSIKCKETFDKSPKRYAMA